MEYPLPPKPYERVGPEMAEFNPRRVSSAYRYTKEHVMRNRRQFVKTVVGATAGIFATETGFWMNSPCARQSRKPLLQRKRRTPPRSPRRRQTRQSRRRARARHHSGSRQRRQRHSVERNAGGGGRALGADRIAELDKRGIDVQALDINAFWWYAAADRDLATKSSRSKTKGSRRGASSIPTALWLSPRPRCNFPTWQRSNSTTR